MIAWNKVVNWAFFAMLSYFAYDLSTTMKHMGVSINELNRNVAVLAYQSNAFKDEISEIKRRLNAIDKR
jgi:hypothetical protein